jgi:outer membrane receptor for ferrienterochelin and colicin
LRGGMIFDGETVYSGSLNTAFDIDPMTGDLSGPRQIPDNEHLYGLFTGFYLQDEWKILPKVTINYGARFDIFNSSFDNENQLSPRVNIIYEPTDKTTLHAGYARYFTPPPVENVPSSAVALFDNTSNAAGTDQDSPVKAERSHYFDAGVSQELFPGFRAGVDGYYKKAKNQLDDGLFGQTLILSAFNYAKGEVYGTEFTFDYTHGGFSAYANIAYSVAKGEDFVSSQFLFDPGDIAYAQNHYINLDHDQTVSGSFGASYKFNETKRFATMFYVDALYGSGLRTDSTAADGSNIPNGGTVPSYYTVNCGVEQVFKLNHKQSLKARIDLVNLTDAIYELRDGQGVGVNAAQFGARRGIFGSLTYTF